MRNQVWESWRDDRLANLTQERDELLAALKAILKGPARGVKLGQWEVWDKAFAAVAKAEKVDIKEIAQ